MANSAYAFGEGHGAQLHNLRVQSLQVGLLSKHCLHDVLTNEEFFIIFLSLVCCVYVKM